jgi:hypothetical protein
VLVGLALAASGVALYILGRGGTVMLVVVALLFGAFAVPMLSMRDRLPDDDTPDDPDAT